MKRILIVLCLLFVRTELHAQGSGDVENIRETRPLSVLVDMTGLGLGLSVHKNVDLQASTMLIASGATVRVYLTDRNSAPFLGLSVGKMIQGLGGNGEANDWALVQAGWNFHPFPTRGLFFAVLYQHPLKNANTRAALPVPFMYTLGIRF